MDKGEGRGGGRAGEEEASIASSRHLSWSGRGSLADRRIVVWSHHHQRKDGVIMDHDGMIFRNRRDA